MSPVATPAAGSVSPGSLNKLKVRDDSQPFEFLVDADGNVEPTGGDAPSWLLDRSDRTGLRSRIEPWLTALVQSDHLSLLVGSGLTTGLAYIAGSTSVASMGPGQFNVLTTEIKKESTKSAIAAGRSSPNIEDEIRTTNQILRGLEILDDPRQAALRDDLTRVFQSFAASVLTTEREIMAAPEERRNRAFNALVTFLMSFASRTGSRDRLGVFTTNYDRVIEVGAELAGLRMLDRFVGSMAPIFRSSRLELDLHYNPPGIRGEPRMVEGVARFTKLHGSLDWVNSGDVIRRIGLPFGADRIDPYLNAPGLGGATSNSLMIYPNASKDRETSEYPYVELFRDFAAAVARPSSTLVTYGYSFGDEHINRVRAIHLSRLDWCDAGQRLAGWCPVSAFAGRVPVMVCHGC